MAALLNDFVLVPGDAPRVAAVLAHDIAGHLRVVVPALQDDARRAAALCAHLHRLQAVQALRFNALTGSLRIAYDGQASQRAAILRALDDARVTLARHASAPSPPHASTLQRAAGAAIKAVMHCVLDLVLETAVVAVV